MRLFVAINFSQSIRDRIWEATGSLRNEAFPVRWVDPQLLHLTIKFVGSVRPDHVPALKTAVTGLASRTCRFSMSITGVGGFPTPKEPHTIWLGCEGVPTLELLQHDVERECAALGFPLEGRPFRPHITLGRVRKGTARRQLQGIDREMERVDLSIVAHVSSVELMASKLNSSRPTYHVVHSQDLAR